MDEEQWRTCRDPLAMLPMLINSAGVRKWWLFAAASFRKALERLDHPQLALALEYARAVEEDESGYSRYTYDELWRGRVVAQEALAVAGGESPDPLVDGAPLALPHNPDVNTGRVVVSAVAAAYRAGVVGSAGGDDFAFQADLLREFFGNPFAAPWFKSRWRTTDVLQLASCVYEIQAFDRLPVLADALEEAGCEQADILGHCREPGEHRRGCWVLDLILEMPE